jgi:hypothetical protein
MTSKSKGATKTKESASYPRKVRVSIFSEGTFSQHPRKIGANCTYLYEFLPASSNSLLPLSTADLDLRPEGRNRANSIICS